MKIAAIRADFDLEVIRPSDAHFGTARPAGLKQQAARVAGLVLVDFQLMPAGCIMGEQCCVGGNRQSVCQIGGCVKPKLVQLLDIRCGGINPVPL